MDAARTDEWKVIESLLPNGWREAARLHGAFRRARYTTDPGALLRLLMFHAVNDGGLRATVAQAKASGIAEMSQVALLKRLRSSGDWLAWIAAELCRAFRERPQAPEGLRLRAIDSTTVQGPASKGTEWRVHYALDLVNLNCDWCELTDAHGSELLERTPVKHGDVLLADRNYLRPEGARHVESADGYLLVRLRWTHSQLLDSKGRRFSAIQKVAKLKVGAVGEWPVDLVVDGGKIAGRVVATKLPAPVAARAERKALKESRKKGKKPDPRSLKASHYVMLFTTIPASLLSAADVLELYRSRWQVELAFKRLKQLLKLGRLPHKDPRAARGWILAKLVVALVLETLYRNASAFSPWGYRISALREATTPAP